MKRRLVLLLALAFIFASLAGLTALADDAEPSVEISYYTVPMTATVEILYAIPADGYDVNPDGTVDGLSLLVWKGAEGTADTAVKLSSQGIMNIKGKNHLVFVYDGLDADEMDVKVYARVSFGDRLGSTKVYSVKDFAASYNGEHKSLVAALIKYGNAIKTLSETPTDAEAEIVNKNGAKGVLTLVSDDGNQRTSDFFYTVVAPKYDAFKITVALPTYNVAGLNTTADGKAYLMDDNGNYVLTVKDNGYNSAIAGSPFTSSAYPTMVDFWKKVTDNGQIEIASHSHSHGNSWPPNDDIVYNEDGSVKYPAGGVLKELRASAQILRDLIGQDTPFIMRPGGTFWENADSDYFYNLVETDGTFIGMRSSNGAAPFLGATSASGAKLNTIEKFQNATGRLKIATILVKGFEAAYDETGKAFVTTSTSTSAECIAAGVSAWTQYVDYAMQYGSWASLGFHSVVADNVQGSGYQVYDSQVLALMDYVEPLVESGDLWLPSFDEAAKYYFEWSSATVTAKTFGTDRVEITLTDREEDSRFDEPLTVKISVPDGWTTAVLDSYGEVNELDIQTAEDGTHFVYANILPGDGISTIRSK